MTNPATPPDAARILDEMPSAPTTAPDGDLVARILEIGAAFGSLLRPEVEGLARQAEHLKACCGTDDSGRPSHPVGHNQIPAANEADAAALGGAIRILAGTTDLRSRLTALGAELVDQLVDLGTIDRIERECNQIKQGCEGSLKERSKPILQRRVEEGEAKPTVRIRQAGRLNTSVGVKHGYDIVDPAKVPREYCDPSSSKVGEAVVKQKTTVPGVTPAFGVTIRHYRAEPGNAG